MVDAVSTVVTNAQFVRNSTEQASSARSAQVQETESRAPAAAPVAPYISPFIQVDTNFDKAVIQIRDSDTGDVVNQFPSESALKARQDAEAAIAARPVRQQQEAEAAAISAETQPQQSELSSAESAPDLADTASLGADVAQAQVASQALTAAAQTSEIAQATVSTSA